jgi:integrase
MTCATFSIASTGDRVRTNVSQVGERTSPACFLAGLRAPESVQGWRRGPDTFYACWRGDLVFATATGQRLDAANVRRFFRAVCTAAGIGLGWTPRELRHTFVSLMSDSDVAVEEIARLVGHASSKVTETVYRHQLRPVMTTGAEKMGTLLRGAG